MYRILDQFYYDVILFKLTYNLILDSDDCKQCDRVLVELEHIDDEADGAGIKFVKVDDKLLSKEFGVFALPAVVFFRMGMKEPVIYAGKFTELLKIM